MVELTVGYVAGLIALAVFIAQVWCPTVITYMLAGVARDKETAATWSVVGRSLQNTLWPDLLRADTARLRGARMMIILTYMWIPITAVLVAIAGVVTPLGLYEVMEPSGSISAAFDYINDSSAFGLATPPRLNDSFARKCSTGHGLFLMGPAPCPYSGNVVVFTRNSTTITYDFPGGYSTAVAPIVKEIYSSGTRNKSGTVSNYFDIQWRQYTKSFDKYTENETEYTVGSYRFIDTRILKNEIQPVEGLLVDAVHGGLGFRNHSLPDTLGSGAAWKEDLLFIEPETRCVSTNLTLDWEINMNSSAAGNGSFSGFWLTDQGGFVDINRTYPYYNRTSPQETPDLEGRAYKAAWLHNAWTMMYMNITNPNNSTYGNKSFSYMNSEKGKRFELPRGSTLTLDGLGLGYKFDTYLGLSSSFGLNGGSYPNPFKVKSDDFEDINVICSGAGVTDIANISNIFVQCGLMRGAAVRTDQGSPFIIEGGSKWSAPLYACASGLKATIKEASFVINNTIPSLEALQIPEVQPKNYSSVADMPLWGMEDSGLAMDGISPVWGLIAPEYKSYPNISYVQQPSFYLPGNPDLSSSINAQVMARSPSGQNMPGSDFGPAAMNAIWYDSISSNNLIPDYTGAANLVMLKRWYNLSSTPETAATIINLVWTDLAAQSVVGTKGAHGSITNFNNATGASSPVTINIQPIEHQIKFKWQFGIPAFLLLIVFIIVNVMALITGIIGRTSIALMRQRLHQSSTGRIFTTFLYPAYSDFNMPSPQWITNIGRTELDLHQINGNLKAYGGNVAPGAGTGVSGNGYAPVAVVDNQSTTYQSGNYHMENEEPGKAWPKENVTQIR